MRAVLTGTNAKSSEVLKKELDALVPQTWNTKYYDYINNKTTHTLSINYGVHITVHQGLGRPTKAVLYEKAIYEKVG